MHEKAKVIPLFKHANLNDLENRCLISFSTFQSDYIKRRHENAN